MFRDLQRQKGCMEVLVVAGRSCVRGDAVRWLLFITKHAPTICHECAMMLQMNDTIRERQRD
jgi:hypothetical protein